MKPLTIKLPPSEGQGESSSTLLRSNDSPPPYTDSPKATDTLLVHTPYSPGYYDDDYESYFTPRNTPKRCRLRSLKWPALIATLIAILVLVSTLTSHLVNVNAPASYATQALNLTISSVSIDDMSADGVHAHVIGQVSFDSAKVKDRPTRVFGKIATTIMRKAEVLDTNMLISRLSAHNQLELFGSASIPNIVVDIRDHKVTPIDFVSTVHQLAAVSDIAKLVEEYLHGTLKDAIFRGDADLPLRSGILPLGTHHVAHDVKLESAISGSIPFIVSDFKFGQSDLDGISVSVAAQAQNPYPIHVSLPGLDWVVEAAACTPAQIVRLAVAHSEPLDVTPHGLVDLEVGSQVADLPRPFTQPCPDSESSAMDRYLRAYLSGDEIVVYVRGKPGQRIAEFPPWVSDLLAVLSIPVPVPGRSTDGSTDKMVKSFGLSRVKIAMPQRVPRISALVNAVIELPKELDFSISVEKLKGISDLFYLGDKFGVLEIDEWTPAVSFYTPEGYIQVVAEISDVPLEITDQAVFKTMLQKMFFSGPVDVMVQGTIDVMLTTPVGEFAVRKLPAKGTFTLSGRPGVFVRD
ncbi:hypothetical protein V1512DRAFT_264179 [Lipomyces arxii]|uniref:uncharacterized protein n=1 Tax=Lipomyces arxii TaxID=56418 RepID=UPI0034CE203C